MPHLSSKNTRKSKSLPKRSALLARGFTRSAKDYFGEPMTTRERGQLLDAFCRTLLPN